MQYLMNQVPQPPSDHIKENNLELMIDNLILEENMEVSDSLPRDWSLPKNKFQES